MLVQVVLELVELLVRDREGVADIARYRIPVGKVTDPVDGIADRLVLTIELAEGGPDRFHIQGRRRIAGYSGGVDPFDGRKEDLFFLPEMGRHVGRYLGEDPGDFVQLGVHVTMDLGDFVGIGGNLVHRLP